MALAQTSIVFAWILVSSTAAQAASPQRGTTELASVDSYGAQGNQASLLPAISADGRFIAFESDATNLVPGDTNSWSDVFVHDRATGLTVRVSVDSAGNQASGQSFAASISADGRFLAFDSNANDLTSGDSNASWDVFVHDLATGQTTRESVDPSGAGVFGDSFEPVLSADGRYVAFPSFVVNLVPGDSNGVCDVFVRDRATGQTVRVSVDSTGVEGNGDSFGTAISADGQFLAFDSFADNLVTPDTNGWPDVFVHDRASGQTARVSVDSAGNPGRGYSQAPAISADGRYVAFWSTAGNLVPGDTNGYADIFVHDRTTGATTRVSVDSAGLQANQASFEASISADGRWVAFSSNADNLLPGDSNAAPDVFIRDRGTGQTRLASVNSAGIGGNHDSYYPALSADGRFIAFSSFSDNLVHGDFNHTIMDVFVHDTFDCSTTTYCTAKPTTHQCLPEIQPAGDPSRSDPTGFVITTTQLESGRNALTLYGAAGPSTLPFQGGWLCIQPPLQRLHLQNAGGSGACAGSISYTLADILAHPGGPPVTVGTRLDCQSWGRDPGDPFGVSLSNGLEFVVCP